LPKRKIGLALSGGAMRGFAHIGVLEILEKEGVPIDMIAGTSAGAVIGALYAQGKDINVIKSMVQELSWKRLASMIDLTLPKSGLIRGNKIKSTLKSIMGKDIKFSELKIPLACVATDVMSGEEVVINEGSVLDGVSASICIPGIFTVAKWHGRYLIDGGLVNPAPVSVLKKMGADISIAVNVIPKVRNRVRTKSTEEARHLKEPNIISVLMQSIYIGSYSLVRSCLKEADIVIEPQVVDIAYGDLHRATECILQGEIAARESIPKIKKLFENYRQERKQKK